MIMQEEEYSIIERCREGDSELYAVLVERYGNMIYNAAYRMVGDPETAKDMAQESFIAAYSALREFRNGSKFSTWLYSIVMNKCKDHLRLRKATVSLDDVAETTACRGQTPEAALCAKQTANSLQAALDTLPGEYREVLVLKHMEGLDYKEMETVLGVSANTLKVRTHRARELLRKYLVEREYRNG